MAEENPSDPSLDWKKKHQNSYSFASQVNDKMCKDKVFSGFCTLMSSPMFLSSNYHHFMYSEYMVLF